jgi:hypothetical protein
MNFLLLFAHVAFNHNPPDFYLQVVKIIGMSHCVQLKYHLFLIKFEITNVAHILLLSNSACTNELSKFWSNLQRKTGLPPGLWRPLFGKRLLNLLDPEPP